MSAINAPYGLLPKKMIGSQAFPAAMIEIPMTTNSASPIVAGQMIALNAGNPVAAAVTPTTTRSTSTPIGVCVGVTYFDPVLKQFMTDQMLPANAISNGYTKVKVLVVDDPDAIFMIQANGAVTQASMGLNAAVAAVTAVDTFAKRSQMTLDTATIANTATLALRIVGFSTEARDAIGDAFTNVLVKFNQGVHAYQNSTGG